MKGNVASNNPLVSVCVITYNQEEYIKQTLEGVLKQETDFDFEVVISNDKSTDSSDSYIQKVISEYKGVNTIHYFNQKENLGMMQNFIFALKQCKGDYIAICEGDDYWIDALKLQKQVDFMEANPDYSICFHKVKILRGNKLFDDNAIESRYNKISEFPATIEDLLLYGNFIHTTSVLFRNLKNELPWELSYSTVGDYFLHIINAQNGHIKRLDDVMAVYREGVGVYSTLSSVMMQEKIAVYQASLLSYLNKKEHKEILLNKIIENIYNLNRKSYNLEYMASVLSFKKVIKLFIIKIKRLLCR